MRLQARLREKELQEELQEKELQEGLQEPQRRAHLRMLSSNHAEDLTRKDLAHRDLKHRDLKHRDLTYMNLMYKDLTCVNLLYKSFAHVGYLPCRFCGLQPKLEMMPLVRIIIFCVFLIHALVLPLLRLILHLEGLVCLSEASRLQTLVS